MNSKHVLCRLAVSLFCIAAISCDNRKRGEKGVESADSEFSRLPISVSPFYDSESLTVQVGDFSKSLQSEDVDSIKNTFAEMRRNWGTLSPEAMFVAAVRAYDLGLKSESIYWFHSAQYRFIFFDKIADYKKKESGLVALDLYYSYRLLQVLIGKYVNSYVISNWESSSAVLENVAEEGRTIPDFVKIFPTCSFVEKEQWSRLNAEARAGFFEMCRAYESAARK